MHENTGEGRGMGRDQMQNYEGNFQLPTFKVWGLRKLLRKQEVEELFIKKSVGLRWKGCGRGLLFRNIKTEMA